MDTSMIKSHPNICKTFERLWSAFSFHCEISSFFSVFLNFRDIDDICKKKMEEWRERAFSPMKAFYTTRKQENLHKSSPLPESKQQIDSYLFTVIVLGLQFAY